MFEDPYRMQQAFALGARGYISKTAGEREILAALETVCGGGHYLEKRLEARLETVPVYYDYLTKREREILGMVQNGMSNAAIAAALRLEIRTVENYLYRLYEKTGARDRGELINL
jgi:DNA-binding NarL/FixJ family response regulator